MTYVECVHVLMTHTHTHTHTHWWRCYGSRLDCTFRGAQVCILTIRWHNVGHCHIAHVITDTNKLCSLPIMPASCSSCPYIDPFENIRMLPMTYNHFSIQPHATHHKTKFPVAMCTLI